MNKNIINLWSSKIFIQIIKEFQFLQKLSEQVKQILFSNNTIHATNFQTIFQLKNMIASKKMIKIELKWGIVEIGANQNYQRFQREVQTMSDQNPEQFQANEEDNGHRQPFLFSYFEETSINQSNSLDLQTNCEISEMSIVTDKFLNALENIIRSQEKHEQLLKQQREKQEQLLKQQREVLLDLKKAILAQKRKEEYHQSYVYDKFPSNPNIVLPVSEFKKQQSKKSLKRTRQNNFEYDKNE